MSHRRGKSRPGFTLIEVVMVVAIGGILLTIAGITLAPQIRGWQMRTAANEVYEDLQRAQQAARQFGAYKLEKGELIQDQVFFSFDTDKGLYEARRWNWKDESNDGKPQKSEIRHSELFSRNLPDGVKFGWGGDVTKASDESCGTKSNSPEAPVTFKKANIPPFDKKPIIHFNRFGFSEEGGGVIYLNKGALTYAIAATRPGNFRLCRWNGSGWQ